MTDTIRDLLISLSSHMAYMQGQLEAHHALDDPEDFYWYRESVLLLACDDASVWLVPRLHLSTKPFALL